MSHVVKVHQGKRDAPIFFIDGWRSDLNDDSSVLQEVLGEDFEEYWMTSKSMQDVQCLDDLVELVDENDV